jgi:hypothetical protein
LFIDSYGQSAENSIDVRLLLEDKKMDGDEASSCDYMRLEDLLQLDDISMHNPLTEPPSPVPMSWGPSLLTSPRQSTAFDYADLTETMIFAQQPSADCFDYVVQEEQGSYDFYEN